MNWTRIIWTIKVMLGKAPKPKLRKLDELMFIAGGNDYEWMNLDPDELCQAVALAGGHGFSLEVGGHMKFHGIVKDYMAHYKKLIPILAKLVEAARFYGLWVKIVMWNTNNPAGAFLKLADLIGLTALLKEKCKGQSNILFTPMSEHSKETPAAVRESYVDYVQHHDGWLNAQTVLMDKEHGPALFREFHIQKPNQEIPYRNRSHFFVVTDSWPTESGSVSHETMVKMAAQARDKQLSFDEYGFEKKMPVQDWKVIGKMYV